MSPFHSTYGGPQGEIKMSRLIIIKLIFSLKRDNILILAECIYYHFIHFSFNMSMALLKGLSV